MLEELKIKKQELNALCEAVKPIKGIHARVCKRIKISEVYSRQIRSGSNANLGTRNNLILLTQMVSAYRKEFSEYIETMKELEQKL